MHEAGFRDCLNRIVAAADVETAWSALVECVGERGLPVVVYGLTHRAKAGGNGPGAEFRFGRLGDALILSTIPGEVMEAMAEAMANSPMTRFVGASSGTLLWSRVLEEEAAGRLGAAEIEAMRRHRARGFAAGVTISFATGSCRSRAGLSLVAAPGISQQEVDRLWARLGPEIEILAQVFHQRIATLPLPVPGARITPRQAEVLGWVAEGKSTAEIGRILGLSQATVEKHLRLAREALGAATTAQALVRLARHNAILAAPEDGPVTAPEAMPQPPVARSSPASRYGFPDFCGYAPLL